MNGMQKGAIGLILALATTASCAAEPDHTGSDSDRALPEMIVYQDPGCGCCGLWVEHMQAHGFTVERVFDANLAERKDALGVPAQLRSCHTAVVGDYVIEGHVPASDVLRLFEENPEFSGLAVPGMPVGSPGMEHGDLHQPYHVLAFDDEGRYGVFNHYPE